MEEEGFIITTENNNYLLTQKGKIASQLKEVHGLVFGRLLEEKTLQKMTTKQLVAIFSCFTNVTVADDVRSIVPFSRDYEVNNMIKKIKGLYDTDLAFEERNGLNTGVQYDIHYDLLEFVMLWCECSDSQQCNNLLKKIEQEKGIFLGEFVKALLKINNMAVEMEKIAEMFGEIDFLSHLKEMGELTLKYVATNQSLYV
jgi:hypothetical protein